MLTPSTCPWDGFEPSAIAWCETRLCAVVAEPANAWSNVAFEVVAAVLFWKLRGARRSPLMLIAVCSLLTGIGSFVYHATGTFWGEFIDVSAMYLFGAVMMSLELLRYVKWSARAITLFYALVVGVSTLATLAVHRLSIPVFVAQMVCAVPMAVRTRRRLRRSVDGRFLLAMMWTFVLAYGIWWTDELRLVCRPDNRVFTGHAAWHVLTALCLYFYYMYQEQFFAQAALAR